LITDIDAWKFIHILLFVYWLGADLGVFLLARAAERSDLTFDQRVIALRMALKIDIVPRLSFALMFPVGLELCAAKGLVDPTFAARPLSWAVSAVWVAIVIGMVRAEEPARARVLKHANLVLHWALFLVVGVIGVTSVLGHGPFPPGWLGWKILLFALIFFCGIMIDRRFEPVAPAFARLAAEGSKPDIEQAITSAIDRSVAWVLALYALVVVIAFLGTARPS
jgi:uncharacterized membrane protein